MQSELPVAVAAFIGREHERVEVGDLVTDVRVVTLTGSGGCGKTRLAMEVVGDVAFRFPDGACWVDLQGVTEPAMVAPAVGAEVGVHERPEQPLTDTLTEHLQARHLLVVLDNCEHLVDACAELVGELSSACPQLHVLATSRVPLAVEGEATFGVAGLPVPDDEAGSAGAVAATDAARLFEVRARQVAADFRIDDDNAAPVAEICQRLDGTPLALELAAARVRVLAPGQIAAGLSDRFGLLTGGVRGAPARQRTLEASLDWSWDLLDDVQRLALARLSVFAGSFELDAAEAVVGGEGIDRGEVLDLVAGLVEQSLVKVVRREGAARYRLLETIRAYARSRLPELDDPGRVRSCHLEFHVGLAERAREGLKGRRPEPWMGRLTDDLDDLRAAMDWAEEAGDLSGLVGMTEPLNRFWFERGLSREVHRRLYDAATRPDAPDDERVRGLTTAAALALAGREATSFHEYASEAVAAARAAPRDRALAVALGHRALSGVLSGMSSSEHTDSDIEEALHQAEQCQDAWIHAYVLQYAGAARLHRNSIDDGCRLLDEAVHVCEGNDLTFQLPAAMGGSLALRAWSGRLDDMRQRAGREVELSRQVGRPGWEATGFTGLAAVAVLRGDHDLAAQMLSEARAALGPLTLEGSLYGVWVLQWMALAAWARGDLDAARASAADLVRVGHGGGNRVDDAMGEWLQGAVAREQGSDGEARTHLERSRALSTDPPIPFTLGRSLLGLAQVAREDDTLKEAWELSHDGLEILDDHGDRVGTTGALEMIADLTATQGDPVRALRLLAASQRFHDDTGIVRFPSQADLFDGARASAEVALDPAGAAAAWDAGGELSLDDAVAYARRGRGERQRPRIGWESLTPVELDVVRLVAEGHTNAEIGERLFISANTVKKHLSRVYARVDVDGRADLAAQVASRGL